ncbi:MAG TPA: GNAT family N-acetyltransferase [Stellaceae bacterium]|nr:GNAT family N-acetyltransferase [Stellaceae bacterium]
MRQAIAQLSDTITYLEMRTRPPRPPLPVPQGKLALMRAEPCTASFYRYLYSAVGEPWLWYVRRGWSDEQLARWLARAEIELSVLYVGGVPAGYFELERLSSGETELCYFGLVAAFVGRGLGAYFLRAAVDAGWQGATRRLWVHTSTYDHPRALGLYQRAGFQVYRRQKVTFDDPRLTGALPRTLTHPLLPPLALPEAGEMPAGPAGGSESDG